MAIILALAQVQAQLPVNYLVVCVGGAWFRRAGGRVCGSGEIGEGITAKANCLAVVLVHTYLLVAGNAGCWCWCWCNAGRFWCWCFGPRAFSTRCSSPPGISSGTIYIVCLFLCLYVSLYLCLSVRPPVCLIARPFMDKGLVLSGAGNGALFLELDVCAASSNTFTPSCPSQITHCL